jgi:hypothetical protein
MKPVAPCEFSGKQPELFISGGLCRFGRLFLDVDLQKLGQAEAACFVFLATSAVYRAVSGIFIRQ